MREIILVFAGNEENERKAADAIQAAVFSALDNERMSVRQFSNQRRERKEKVMIGTPRQREKDLVIPDFLHNYGKTEAGNDPSAKPQ